MVECGGVWWSAGVADYSCVRQHLVAWRYDIIGTVVVVRYFITFQ